MTYVSPPLPEPDRAPLHSPRFTGQATVPAGTAAAPGLAVGSAPQTGVFAPTPDSVALATGGGERLRCDARQVGVGTWLRASSSDSGRSLVALNAYYDPADGALKADNTHGVIGAGGWAFNGVGWNTAGFFLNPGSVSSGQVITPAWRIVVRMNLIALGGADGSESLRINSIAGAVNRVEVAGAGIGSGPRLAAAGTDATVHLRLSGQGSGTIILENLPTSPAGLPAGGLWNDAGTLKVA